MNLADYISALNEELSGYCTRKLSGCDITYGQLAFVVYIGEHPSCSPTELARAVDADTGHTTRSVKKLVSCGMVSRERHSTDGRAFVLSLTDRGMEMFDEIIGIYRSWESEKLGVLSAEEREILISLLRRLRDPGAIDEQASST